MNVNIEERKKTLLRRLEEEQNKKPERWWHTKNETYQTTAEAANENGIVRQSSAERIIQYDLKGALISSALFFIIIFLTNILPAIKAGQLNETGFQFLIFAVFVFWPVVKALNRKPVMVIDEKGLWFCKTGSFIEWKDIAASYIKKVDNDGTSNYLLVHFYNDAKDMLDNEEIYLDNLDIKIKDLSAEIECRKMMR
jgi:hypothetical protein